MFGRKTMLAGRDASQASLAAIGRSMAVIEFTPDGTILGASDKFLGALGYTLPEIVGKHHRIFVDPAYAASAEYTSFWNDLRQGRHQAAQFRRIGKGGGDVWIEASYNPVIAADGKVVKVVKVAVDVTARKGIEVDRSGKLAAIEGAGDDRIRARRHHRDGERELPGHGRLHARRNQGPASQPVRGRRHRGQPGLPALLGRSPGRQVLRRAVQADRQGRQGGVDPGVLQPDLRRQRQAREGRQIRHRHHGADRPPEQSRAELRRDRRRAGAR